VGQPAPELFLDVAGTEFAAFSQDVQIFGIGFALPQQLVGQLEQLLEVLVPRGETQLLVEHDDPIAHVVEGDAQFGLALADLVEQSGIVDRYDRLRGEVFEQRDLLLGVGPDLLSIASNHAQEDAILAERNNQIGAHAASLRDQPSDLVHPFSHALIGPLANVVTVNQPGAIEQRWRREKAIAQHCGNVFGITECRHGAVFFPIVEKQRPQCCSAQQVSFLQDRLEHRLQIARRAVDHLQHLSGRGLLFECLLRLGDQPRVLHRDDCLRGEALEQGDLFFGKCPHLGSRAADHTEQGVLAAQRYA
jgi:hypothetical protein